MLERQLTTTAPNEAWVTDVTYIPTDEGFYREIFNSDSEYYGGSNLGNRGGVLARATGDPQRPVVVQLTLPPLAVVVLKL